MRRALNIAKTVGSLLAIEMLVPGGTLIVLTLLLSGRQNVPLLGALQRRVPTLARVMRG